MKIRTLHIDNCRLIDHLDDSMLSFDGGNRAWTMLVGTNGSGKSTILQAIALLAAGSADVDELVKLPAMFVDERNPRPVRLAAEFVLPDDRILSSRLTIQPGKRNVDGDSWFGALDAQPTTPENALGKLRENEVGGADRLAALVVGLGVTRRIPLPEPTPDAPVSRCLGSLFGGASHATNLIDRLEVDESDRTGQSPDPESKRASHQLADDLDDVLARKHQLLPRVTSVMKTGRGGIVEAAQLSEGRRIYFKPGTDIPDIRIPARWLSQGYQSVFTIAADVLGNAYIEAGRPVHPDEVTNLILIDELDLHVHPQWQMTLVETLGHVFNNAQFIATTHSPLLLSGLGRSEIYLLGQDLGSGTVSVARSEIDPALGTGTELLRDFYGIDQAFPNEVGAEYEEYGVLATDPTRTIEEDARVHELRASLSDAGIAVPFEPLPMEAAE